MAKITKIGQAEAREIGGGAEIAVKAFAESNGLAVSRGSGSIAADRNSITIKFTFSIKDAKGIAQDPARAEWKALAHYFDLKVEWLDQEFNAAGTRYRVVGLRQSSRKFPVLAERLDDGKTYKFPVWTIQRVFGAAAQKIEVE